MNRKFALIILMILSLSGISVLSFYVRPAKAIIWVGGHITSDTTWTPADAYRVINDTYVDPTSTLTILPGVHVQFADGFSLFVEGNLNATGTNADPIIFTSSRISPTPGAWNTIQFNGSSIKRFLVNYIKVEYAIDGITINSLGETMIANSQFVNCSSAGLKIDGSANAIIKDNKITYNSLGIATDDSATHRGVLIDNNIISHNKGNGIHVYGYAHVYGYTDIAEISDFTIVDNNILNNDADGVYISTNSDASYSTHNRTGYIHNIVFLNNSILLNGKAGVNIHSDRFCHPSGYPYSINVYNIDLSKNRFSDNYQGINIDTGWSGSIYNVSISSNNLMSNQADGATLQSIGGNVSISLNAILSNYGNGASLSGSGCYLSFADNVVSSNRGDGISIKGSGDLKMLKNIVSSNVGKGIYVYGINSTLSLNSISHNVIGIHYDYAKNNLANYNDVYNNNYGMNVTSATVSAEYNYWGDSTGPYHPSVNPEGKGNRVNGNGADLDFIPFLTSPHGHINQLPVAMLSVNKKTVDMDETVIFDATNSTDDGRLDYYFFNFGDGTNTGWTNLPVVAHKYAMKGTYYATVIVMDDYGVTSTNTELIKAQITVVPEFPSFLILPLFMIATLLAVTIYRKSMKRRAGREIIR